MVDETWRRDSVRVRLGLAGLRLAGLRLAGLRLTCRGSKPVGLGVASLFAALFLAPGVRGQGEIHQFVGGAAGDALGWSVAAAGDMNQDGSADVIVGARFADSNGLDSGSVFVYSGKDAATLHVFFGDQPKDGLGVSVASAGDVDMDGYLDVIAGAADWNFGVGMARVYSGKDGQTLHTFQGIGVGAFGWSVAGAGDLNNDGYADLVVGALFDSSVAHESGRTQAFSGFDGASMFQFDGTGFGYWEGYAVDGLGDVTGDGFVDVVSSAPRAPDNGVSDVGRVVVLDGTTGFPVQVNHGDQPLETMGLSLGRAGDVNNDGFADYVAGSPTYAAGQIPDAGRLRVFSGATSALLWEVGGGGIGGNLGQSTAAAGDIDGDGFDDVIGGAPGDTTGFPLAGNARVYSGADASVIGTLPGDPFLSDFAYSVAGVGDVDQDGVPDLLAGAPGGPFAGPASGHARIISGACLSVHVYGGGAAGTGGVVPTLTSVGGLPSIGNSGFQLLVNGGVGGAPAAIVVGIAPASLGVLWGDLLVDLTKPFLFLPIGLGGASGSPGAGQNQVPAPIPNQVALVGGTAFIQVLIGDPGSLGGISSTNGLEIGICR